MGALALLGILAFLETNILVISGPSFPEPAFNDGVRYVAVGSQGSVRFPEQTSLILDCLPYAVNAFGVQANLSSIQWFRIATNSLESVGAETEIVNNMTVANVFLVDNKERLFLQKLSIAAGAQVGTEAAYRCEVCRNVPPEPMVCANTTTVVNVEGLPTSVSRYNDTVIGPSLYEVAVTVDEEGNKVSLCYEVQGEANQYFNLISDTCVSVNALYSPMINPSDGNIISKIGVLATDNNGGCQQIEADLEGCTARVNGRNVKTTYCMGDIHVIRHTNVIIISVPNCDNNCINQLEMWVVCEVRGEQPMIKFVISRELKLNSTSHGLIGQFWNAKVEAERYNLTAEDKIAPAPGHYAVTVNAQGGIRRFFAIKGKHTWDMKRSPCLYSGDAQGESVYEVTSLSGNVIQGTYNEYIVNGPLASKYRYEMFRSKCS